MYVLPWVVIAETLKEKQIILSQSFCEKKEIKIILINWISTFTFYEDPHPMNGIIIKKTDYSNIGKTNDVAII